MQQNFLTPDQLFDFFIMEEAPYWTLYNARRTREVISSYKKSDQGEITSDELLSSSWEQLHKYLFMHPGGIGKLVLKKSPNANNQSSPTLYVKWGNADTSAVAGIGALPGHQSNGMDSMTNRLLNEQKAHYEQRLLDQEKFLELKFQLQNQEAVIEGLMEPTMQESVIQEVAGLAKVWMTSNAMRPQAQLGTSGDGNQMPPPPRPDADFDPNAASADIERIQQSIPTIPVNQVLNALAVFAERNPEMAAGYLQTLIQQAN
jgi:hypothetical protein